MPREWEGETAFLLGGGPSLALVEVSRLRDRGRVIATNNAGLAGRNRAPWADVLLFSDQRWLDWNRHRLAGYRGPRLVRRGNTSLREPPPGLLRLGAAPPRVALSRDPSRLAGACTGGAAINLAWLLGARRIVLLGYDMAPGHWHGEHRMQSRETVYAERMIPAIRKMAAELAAAGAEVVNASPGSRLDCFPVVDLSEVAA